MTNSKQFASRRLQEVVGQSSANYAPRLVVVWHAMLLWGYIVEILFNEIYILTARTAVATAAKQRHDFGTRHCIAKLTALLLEMAEALSSSLFLEQLVSSLRFHYQFVAVSYTHLTLPTKA